MSEMTFRLQPRQLKALFSKANEILYGGAAGGGKSYLMRAASIIFSAGIPHLQTYLFRKTYPELKSNHLSGGEGYRALLSDAVKAGFCKINLSGNSIDFANGSQIHLCHCQNETDVYKYQGAEIHLLLLDEGTHFLPKVYQFLRGRCRLGGLEIPEQYQGMFPRIIVGTNPGGVSHNFFKAKFVDLLLPEEIRQMQDEEGGFLRQYIPAKLTDNQVLMKNDPTYAARLKGLGNKSLVKAMLEGDWNIVSGGAFDDVWQAETHVIKPFKIPSGWRVDRSFDWGSTHPFAVIWVAEANGEEIKEGDMKGFCPHRGSLIVFAEWYGSTGEPNEGLKISAREIATGIKERENKWREQYLEGQPIYPGPADNQIFSMSNDNCIADDMARVGIEWTHSNKSPGTRVRGLELMRTRFKNALQTPPEAPGIYIFESCRNLIAQLPTLPRDKKNPEDVDTGAEDHLFDALRYRVLAAESAAVDIQVTWF